MRDTLLHQMADVIAIAGWLPVALFVAFYGFRSPWRKHLVGRSLMYQSIAMLTLLTVVIIGLWWPDMPHRDVLRFASYTFLFLTMFRMFFTLLHYQNMPEPPRSVDNQAMIDEDKQMSSEQKRDATDA